MPDIKKKITMKIKIKKAKNCFVLNLIEGTTLHSHFLILWNVSGDSLLPDSLITTNIGTYKHAF